MRKYTRKLMAAAMCAAMTASMIPASTWAGENSTNFSKDFTKFSYFVNSLQNDIKILS